MSIPGPTTVSAGTLQAGATNTFSPNSLFTVASGATLDLAGFDQTIPGLINHGTVRTGGSPNNGTGTILTVAGDYSAGSTLALNTVLASDGSPSDLLRIDGGAATGTTSVIVNDDGGGGDLTTGDGILAIDAVNGGTTAPRAFGPTLALAGPYEYRLFRGNLAGTSPDNWYLRSNLQPIDPTDPPTDDPPGSDAASGGGNPALPQGGLAVFRNPADGRDLWPAFAGYAA